jgi:hypothetical protein
MYLRHYKCWILTSLQWIHPVRQTHRMDVPVNIYSHWKCRIFTSLQWTHPVRQTHRMDLPVNLHSHSRYSHCPCAVSGDKTSNTTSFIWHQIFINLQGNKVVLHLSDVPVYICLPSTCAACFEMCPIKRPTRLKQPHYRGDGRRRRLQFECL